MANITNSEYRPVIMSINGMVCSGHWLASQVGIKILQEGGNAIDAAVATAAALNVVEPMMSRIGGEALIMIYRRGEATYAVNGTGVAPGEAAPHLYTERAPEYGPLSISIPGALAAWSLALERFGTMALSDVLKPAIHLAEQGSPVSYFMGKHMASWRYLLSMDPDASRIFLRNAYAHKPGQVIRQPDLARTLEKIAVNGIDEFYCGSISDEIVNSIQSKGGILTKEDLESYEPEVLPTIETSYRDYRILAFPPNSDGYVLLEELNIIEDFDLKKLGQGTADCIHLMVEAKKLAFADREKYNGDPRYVDIPLDLLISKEYARERRSLINPHKALSAVPHGRLCSGSEDTTYLCVVDRDRNMVSLNATLGSGYGSGVVAGRTGVVMNDRMNTFHMVPGHSNYIQPGKRIRNALNPAMVFDNDQPFLVIGSPGGDGIVQTVFQVLVNIIDFNLNPQKAIEMPRWYSCSPGMISRFPHGQADELRMEGLFPPGVRQELSKRGHTVNTYPDRSYRMGSIQAVMINSKEGSLLAGADYRRDAYAIGY